MKISYGIIIMISILLVGCGVSEPLGIHRQLPPSSKDEINIPMNKSYGSVYVAIEPRYSPWFSQDTPNGEVKYYWSQLNHDEKNSHLPLERSFVSVIKIDSSGSAKFLPASISKSTGNYKITLDYGKFRDDVMGDPKVGVPVRVGIGVRIIVDITTAETDLDIGNLFAVAIAAKQGYLRGQIEVLKIGIDSPSLNLVLPPPAVISDTSVQNALQAAALIRAKIYDKDTILTPHILAAQVNP
ncbi:hypothetical protein [Pectobacterium polaris]|uniref:hypothetical protein n=1 Tax=Pectobacterium polaris TaxID=2042057 RepID=UPI0019699D6D|nr:hypothetical protein [Pectobacterium polaris]MBN3215931.1 hypothetical protein [Pectobacterium polaris]